METLLDIAGISSCFFDKNVIHRKQILLTQNSFFCVLKCNYAKKIKEKKEPYAFEEDYMYVYTIICTIN